MMAGPSFGSAVAVSQGAGELELGMTWLGRIFGAWHCCAGAMHHGGATRRSGRRAAGGGRRTALGGRRAASGGVAALRSYNQLRGGRRAAGGVTHRVAPTIWSGGVFGGDAPRRGGVAALRPYNQLRGGRCIAGGDAPRGRRAAGGGRCTAEGDAPRGDGRRAAGGRRAASPLRYDMVGRDFWGVALLRRDDASRGADRKSVV